MRANAQLLLAWGCVVLLVSLLVGACAALLALKEEKPWPGVVRSAAVAVGATLALALSILKAVGLP
ncbi:hypothetical protein AB0I69_19545 [Streptomyces sp. NPDC050508]|uniref:hypothetical protein n=1 Tax=Streptomyces sp. NPDC050508 TaxID=3155405 RepID=UPI00341880A9